MELNYEKLRDRFHDLKSRSTSFNTGIKLLKERFSEKEDYQEIIELMDEALNQVNSLWASLKDDIRGQSGRA